MVEIKEVLRLWRAGTKKKRIATQLTLDVKTVRRYVRTAEGCGLAPGPEALSDEQVAMVIAALSPEVGHRGRRIVGRSDDACRVDDVNL